MIDKRAYERIPIGSECIVYAGGVEYTGKVIDISEGGVGLKILDTIDENDIYFTFIDESALGENGGFRNVYTCKGKVVRKNSDIYGCRIESTTKIKDYVAFKKKKLEETQ